MPISINCTMFHRGRCAHPVTYPIFSSKDCILTRNDPRITQCECRTARVLTPMGVITPPPKRP